MSIENNTTNRKFTDHYREKKWDWLMGGFLGPTVAGVASLAFIALWALIFHFLDNPVYGYVLDSLGQPLQYGFVCNSVGKKEQTDLEGRFLIESGWGENTTLNFFSAEHQFLGSGKLVKLPNGEYETIHLQPLQLTQKITEQRHSSEIR